MVDRTRHGAARGRLTGANATPAQSGALAEYASRRTFSRTPEPVAAASTSREGPLLFVVQQHAARRLHFDFRLELDGVLKSWAIPKGLSLDPRERRLAVATEDHPFDYASFEGVIPAGQYGAGQVIVWDCGVYAPHEDNEPGFGDRDACQRILRKALEAGKLSIHLRGVKLKGRFVLVRSADGKNWFAIKHGDRFAGTDAPAGTSGVAPEASPLSGRTVNTVGRLPLPERLSAELLVPWGSRESPPRSLAPMLAQAADALPAGPGWTFEPKLDGYRVIAFLRGGTAALTSRGGGDYTAAFPEIVAELQEHGEDPMVLDAELIVLDEQGRPSFNALQNRAQLKTRPDIERAQRRTPAVLYCFDLLHFAGRNLRACPYTDRHRYLLQCLLPSAHVLVIHADPDGAALYRAALDAGFEGVVAKRSDSTYAPGRRSTHWLKLKSFQSAEFVIGGYTRGKGARHRLGALLIGDWEGGSLHYAGHCGTGFDEAMIEQLLERFAKLQADASPFAEQPDTNAPAVWLRPVMVAEVKFAEWTPEGRLRAPVFLRLRPDVAAKSVRRRGAPAPRTGQPAALPIHALAPDAPPVRGHPGSVEAGRQTVNTGRETVNTSRGAVKAKQEGDALLEQLDGKAARLPLRLGGERFTLTNLDRVYWPPDPGSGHAAITKRDLLRYLVRVAPFMLPHLADRPLTMIRMPEGIHGERFYQKHWDLQPLPGFVETVELFSESRNERQRYLLCNNVATLVWLGQMGTLEFHVWHSRISTDPEGTGSTDFSSSPEAMDRSILSFPDYLVFDIDPYIYSGREPAGAEPEFNVPAFEKGKEVAFWLRDLLAEMSLEAIVKTSGKTGLHVFVPIRRTIDFDAARHSCEMIGRHLMRTHRRDITMEWSVPKRTGKIFIDYNMNVRGKTLNAAYSPRGVPGAAVSMPLTWEELAAAQPLDFTIANVPALLEASGDRWAGVLGRKQDLEQKLIVR